MASERQIEANRRNASRSTGPRSAAGKKRAGRNAYRHGLSLSLTSNAATAKQVDKLSRKIAGNTKNEVVLKLARDAAEAVLELERIRKFKIALIEQILALGAFEPAAPLSKMTIRQLELALAGKARLEAPIDPLATLPLGEPQRSAEALRRALPDLVRLDRYEGRASGRRDHAIKQIRRSSLKSLYKLK